MDIIFKKYEDKDHGRLIALWGKSGLPYKLDGRDAREIIQKQNMLENTCFYIAEIDGKLIGSVFATHDGRKGWVNRLAVDPDFGRRGIAGMLIEKAELWFREKGIKVYACLIEQDNEWSQKAFLKKGYVKKENIKYFVKKPWGEV